MKNVVFSSTEEIDKLTTISKEVLFINLVDGSLLTEVIIQPVVLSVAMGI